MRGYNWLTILPQELTAAVGGADGLRTSGAFTEVQPLAAGGVWLRATDNFADYDLAAAEPVFRTLAPILPPGKPMPAPDWANATPMVIVPADYRSCDAELRHTAHMYLTDEGKRLCPGYPAGRASVGE